MQLSAFSVVDSYREDVAAGRDRLRELGELAVACDAAGLANFWVAEHHFHEGGACPAPPVVLASLGPRTRRLRLGVLVSVLPFHNPVELAEQYALLDQVLEGRLNLGVGSGYIPLEFEGFGIDPTTKRERFEANLATMLAAFRGDEVHSPGADGQRVRVNVLPRQRPHPPLWVAVQRREALPFVARQGRNVALVPYATVQNVAELAEEIAEFRQNLPAGTSAKVSVALHVYAGENAALARRALQRYLDSRLATQSAFYQDKVRRDPRHASAEMIESTGFALLGRPAEVLRRLEKFQESGVDEVLGIFDFGGLPLDQVCGSVASLGAAWPTDRGP